jgi:hypothetical protein
MAYFVKKSDKKQSIKSANAAGPVTFEKFYDIVDENVKAKVKNMLRARLIFVSKCFPKARAKLTAAANLFSTPSMASKNKKLAGYSRELAVR